MKIIECETRADSERGAVAVIVAILLIVFIGFAALAVDVGYMMTARNELQNAADAAALAATRTLGNIYEPMSPSAAAAYTLTGPDEFTITDTARQVATQNKAAGSNVVLDITKSAVLDPTADVQIGNWDGTNKAFTQTANRPDAVRVTARRVGSNQIGMFFARFFGQDSVPVSATATAALTGITHVGPGGLPIPLGISARYFLDPNFCGKPIRLYPACPKEPCDPAVDGCAGWHTYFDPQTTPPVMRQILAGLTDLTFTSPDTHTGDTFQFSGGTWGNMFKDKNKGDSDWATLVTTFNTMRVLNDGVWDMECNGMVPGTNPAEPCSFPPDPNTWTTKVVVYDSATCANPNQPAAVVGFATVVITNVSSNPKMVDGKVLCDLTSGRGNGSDYGTLGVIPNLVQ